MKIAKGNFFVRLCYAVVGKTKDTSKMTTKEVIEEFLRQKGVSSPREFFRKKFRKKVSQSIGLTFFSEKALKTQPSNKIRKGIKKLLRRITEHEYKIANPKEWYPQWETMPNIEKLGIIYNWQKEIKNFQDGISNRIDELKLRGEEI